MIYRKKIPLEYFITYGYGESNYSIHAGSFDQALKKAKIHNANLIFYSSILPKEAKEVKMRKIESGEVLDCIAAVANGRKNQKIVAGLAIGYVYKKKEFVCGLVAEYHENGSIKKAKNNLRNCIKEMFKSRFGKGYKLKKIRYIIKEFKPKKKFGTVVVAIVFTKHKLV